MKRQHYSQFGCSYMLVGWTTSWGWAHRGVGEGRAILGRDERGLPAILSLTPLELEVR